MDLDKEAFEFRQGDKNLTLIFTPESAKQWIHLLAHSLRPKEENGMGYENKFYVCMTGSPISLS